MPRNSKRTPYRAYDPYGSQAPIGHAGIAAMRDDDPGKHSACKTCGQLNDEHDRSGHILSAKQFPRK